MTRQSHARTLRANQTDAEQQLWRQLRGRRFLGVKFRRQQPLGPYIVDFVSMEHRLIIELDGGQHSEQADYDRQRDTWLESQGFRVLRFWNSEVFRQWDEVLEAIRLTVVETSPSSPATFPPDERAGKRNNPPPATEAGLSLLPSWEKVPEGRMRGDHNPHDSEVDCPAVVDHPLTPSPSPARGEGSKAIKPSPARGEGSKAINLFSARGEVGTNNRSLNHGSKGTLEPFQQ